MTDLVGINEIAERLEVKPKTVIQWRWLGKLPEEQYNLSGTPIWRWARIEKWAIETGRL